MKLDTVLKFTCISSNDVKKAIMSLNPKKATSDRGFTKLFRQFADDISDTFADCYNNDIIASSRFSDFMKFADVIPSFKADDACDKTNYRPISLLPTPSKVIEKLLAKQLRMHFENIFSPLLCGFRAKHSTQHARPIRCCCNGPHGSFQSSTSYLCPWKLKM